MGRVGLICVSVLLLGVGRGWAHETDQYTVPVGQTYVDLGDFFNRYFINAIEDGVRRTNRRIDMALGGDGRRFSQLPREPGTDFLRTYDTNTGAQDLAYLHSGEAVAVYVRRSIPDAVSLIEGLESKLHSKEMVQRYPDQVVAYHPSDFKCVYAKVHFPLDPRSLFRLWRASTVKVYGTYLGTDKVGHFVDMGYHYYRAYRRLRKRGMSERRAMYEAVHSFDGGVMSESSVLGYMTAGAYSNADMTSNYVGCLLFRNLTEPIRLKGRIRPPIVVRDGDYWMLNPYVKDEPDFFSWFISDHYDEVLNPSHFEKGMQKAMRRAIVKRCQSLRDWYADENGEHRQASYFRDKVYQLSTYYNYDYGHSAKFDELMHLGNICVEASDGERHPITE